MKVTATCLPLHGTSAAKFTSGDKVTISSFPQQTLASVTAIGLHCVGISPDFSCQCGAQLSTTGIRDGSLSEFKQNRNTIIQVTIVDWPVIHTATANQEAPAHSAKIKFSTVYIIDPDLNVFGNRYFGCNQPWPWPPIQMIQSVTPNKQSNRTRQSLHS
jgi:hypothetical protein